MSDRGDNWNERWQEALTLPNGSEMEKGYRYCTADTTNREELTQPPSVIFFVCYCRYDVVLLLYLL